MKDNLRVRFAADTAPQEFGDAPHQALANLLEVVHGPGLREEPLPVAEGVGVLRPESAHGRVPNVADQQVGPDVSREARDVELRSLVERAAADEHFAPLVEAEAPSKGIAVRPRTQRFGFERKNPRREVRAISDDSEQTCHRCSPR